MGKVLKTIGDNTLKLMRLMAEHNYITSEGLVGQRGMARNTMFLQMNLVKKAGLVEEFETMMLPRKAYCLTGDGYDFLEERQMLRVSKRFSKHDFSTTYFKHTLLGFKTRLLFESHPYVFDWRTQKVVANMAVQENRTITGKLNDAEMFLNSTSGPRICGMEIELTMKSRDTYKRQLMLCDLDEYISKRLNYILWLCGNEAIINAISSILITNEKLRCPKDEGFRKYYPSLAGGWHKIRQPEKHRFILLKDFFEKRFEAPWLLASGQREPLLPWPVQPELKSMPFLTAAAVSREVKDSK